MLADQTDYVWDPEGSHPFFVNITTNFSKTAIDTVSLHINCSTVTPLFIDATPLNYNTMLSDKTGKNSLNSTFKNTQETLNRTEILSQQYIQSPSLF